MSCELGRRIADLLRNKGMQQRELAERIGLTEATMSRYISGERDPKPEVIANIATALHTTSDYLLGIESGEFDFPRIQRMIARNASGLSAQEKKELISALFGEE
nr:helix-turn-helix transcriptional regulator [uncultured Oscillibacter sp.]